MRFTWANFRVFFALDISRFGPSSSEMDKGRCKGGRDCKCNSVRTSSTLTVWFLVLKFARFLSSEIQISEFAY